MAFEDIKELVVGWKTDIKGNPDYWSKAKSVPGNQDADDLVRIKGESLANHTVLVAQSGSGKSFFLGRILEEIVIKTRARVVILDPNGDFRRFSEVVKDEEWKTYATKKPKYPHEPSKSDFEPKWKAMEIVVYGGPQNRPKESQFLKIGWDTFPISFLSEELEPIGQSQVYHCHEFVKAIMLLEALTNWDLSGSTKKTSTTSALLHARTLLKRSRAEGIRTVLDDVFPIVEEHDQGNQRPEKWFLPSLPFVLTLGTDWRKLSADDARARAIAAAEFVTPEVERFYFGRANEYVAAKLVSDSLFHRPAIDAKKVAVIDLPSFQDSRVARVVLSSIVETFWSQARQNWAKAFEKAAEKDDRVPVFLVMEEAHNIVPSGQLSPSASALRDQIRTIAAEGRKYGVFLILVTQRPDKIDPLIVSECENRAVMRIAESAVDITSKLLSLEVEKDYRIKRLSSLQKGRFVLVGPWASECSDIIGLAAMRRTEEGGRSLQETYWVQPESTAPKPKPSGKPKQGPTSTTPPRSKPDDGITDKPKP